MEKIIFFVIFIYGIKLFLNAHLIRNDLVDVDTTLDYKYKTKFLNLQSKLIKEV